MTDRLFSSASVRESTTCGRDPLIRAIVTFLARQDLPSPDEIRSVLEREIDAAGPEAVSALSERLALAGTDWAYYPRDPLARRLHHQLAATILRDPPVVLGIEHLAAVAGQPTIVFANHLSYSDANLLEVVFHRAGAVELADRLTVVAGPKVYSNQRRRFSSLCFGTIKVPQSSARSSDEATMTTRDVAVAARRSIDIAHERLRLGDALLVFPEGTRSRTRQMQEFLAGTARYLDGPDVWILPVGLAGSETLFPIAEDGLHPVRIVIQIGRPFRPRDLVARVGADRQLIMDAIGAAIAGLLPEPYRGAYGARLPRGAGHAR